MVKNHHFLQILFNQNILSQGGFSHGSSQSDKRALCCNLLTFPEFKRYRQIFQIQQQFLQHYCALFLARTFIFPCRHFLEINRLRLDSSPLGFLTTFFVQNLKLSKGFHMNPKLDLTKLFGTCKMTNRRRFYYCTFALLNRENI